MESVSSYFLQRQNWRENIFTVVESWTGISESYVSSSDTDSLTIEYVDVENNVRFAIIFAKNVSIFSGNFPNQKCCFRFSPLSLSLFVPTFGQQWNLTLDICLPVNSLPVPAVWYFVEKRRDSRNDWKTIFVRQTTSGENNKVFHILCQSDYSESKFFYNYVHCLCFICTSQVAASY